MHPKQVFNCKEREKTYHCPVIMIYYLVSLLAFAGVTTAFQSKNSYRVSAYKTNNLYAVPLELEGQLDASRKWDVTLEFNGVSKVVSVSEGSSILDVAEVAFDGMGTCRTSK